MNTNEDETPNSRKLLFARENVNRLFIPCRTRIDHYLIIEARHEQEFFYQQSLRILLRRKREIITQKYVVSFFIRILFSTITSTKKKTFTLVTRKDIPALRICLTFACLVGRHEDLPRKRRENDMFIKAAHLRANAYVLTHRIIDLRKALRTYRRDSIGASVLVLHSTVNSHFF